MRLWRLLGWLAWFALRGKLFHEVYLSVELHTKERALGLTGLPCLFEFPPTGDRFFIIHAESEDPYPYIDTDRRVDNQPNG